MPRPFRMATSAVQVRLHTTDTTGLLRDPVFDVPTETVPEQFEDTVITMQVQPRFQRHKDQQPSPTGDNSFTRSWLDVAAHELTRVGITNPFVLKNALVQQISRLHGADAEDFIVVEVRPRGHLTNGPVFYQLFLEKHEDTSGGP